MARFQRSQLFSIRRGQAKCRIVGNCGELWGIVEGEKGYFGRNCCRIVGKCGRIWGKIVEKKEFCRLMF